MATKKQATKPAPKPAARPTPKPLPRPKQDPIDLVRNPNFDSAMAQKNYANFMAAQQARLASQRGQRSAEDISNQYNKLVGDLGKPTDPQAGFRQAGLAAKQGQFTQGRLMGAPTNQPAQSRVPMGFSTYEEAGIPPEQAKILDDEMAKMQSEIAAQEYASNINELMRAQPRQAPQPMQTIAGPRSAAQMNPQKMQAFQNFLQQGIQRSNTMNQDAAAGFANLQPRMQPTQPAMPVAGMGMGMQQPRQAPAPRKFSIASNPSAKAF